MRSTIIIFAGLLLLGLCVLVGRFAGAAPPSGTAIAALVFIPIWLVVAAVNLWIGVGRGYSVAEELPIFLLIFAIPAALAAFVWWKFSRG